MYSIYEDQVIGHHLNRRREKCPGSICVRQGVADALAGRGFNPLHTSKENLYFYRFYELGYSIALGYLPQASALAHRRGYEDYLTGLECLENSQEYLEGYHQAAQDESNEIDRGRGFEEKYYHDIDNRPL